MPPHHTPISRLDLAREPGAQVRNLDLAAYTQLSEEDQAKGVQTKFNLMSSTQHDGQPESGTYRTYVHFKANDQWSAVAPPPHAPCDAPLAFALSCLSCAEEPYSRALPRNPSTMPSTPLQVRHPGPARQRRPPAAHLRVRVVHPGLRLVPIMKSCTTAKGGQPF